MPWYRKHSQIFFPLVEQDFIAGMENGKFVNEKHKGFIALLYYTGVRVGEVLRAKRGQFEIREDRIYFDVGPRLKGGLHTAPLPILIKNPFVDEIIFAIQHTKFDEKVWPYCKRTGYNIVDRVFTYPHHFRLTKITMLFRKGFTIDQVRTWTGHKELGSLNAYAGYGNVEKMAEV